MFPGQGSQKVGMGRDLFTQSSQVRELFQIASDAINIDVAKLYFDGPIEDLTKTENLQPCLVTVSIAYWMSIKDKLKDSSLLFAGHSLGE